uniref:Uncharacterized protein n=1 Tax=Anguilla anguilla TaxID=7936 RepID=A0A0E9VWL9_ANGAN
MGKIDLINVGHFRNVGLLMNNAT